MVSYLGFRLLLLVSVSIVIVVMSVSIVIVVMICIFFVTFHLRSGQRSE